MNTMVENVHQTEARERFYKRMKRMKYSQKKTVGIRENSCVFRVSRKNKLEQDRCGREPSLIKISPQSVLYILSTVSHNSEVIGLPLFSGTSFPEGWSSLPLIPHPYSQNSCDFHSFAPSISTGTFLKTQATTWTKQLQKNENSTTHFPQLF